MATDCRLLQENGSALLQEDGFNLLIDGCLPASPPGGSGAKSASGRAANPRAQAMREAEHDRRLERLRREDDELLILL